MSSASQSQLFQVSGLWCSSCARALQHSLGRLAGVDEASVDFVTHTLKIRFGATGSLAAVRTAVEGMGYRIEPYRDLGSLREELGTRTRGELMRLAWVAFFSVWTMALALVEYTEAMGPLSDREFRWLAIGMGTLCLTGIFGGAYKVYFIGLSGMLRGRPSIDSLLVVASLSCLGLSFYNLFAERREVYFDSAILVIAIVLGIRAVLASLGMRQLDILYRSLQLSEPSLRVVEDDGSESLKPVNTVQPGYHVRIGAGEVIAVDGRVLEGSGAAQSALFTGEAEPIRLARGSSVIAGEVLLEGDLLVEVDAYYGERQIDRLGKQVLSSFHVPARKGAVDTALALAAPVLLGLAALSLLWLVTQGMPWELALPRSLAVVIVGCPCALFFCRPLPLIRAQLAAQRGNLLLLRPLTLSRLGAIRVVAFDKTGTLTSRASRIEILSNESAFSESELWALLAGAELNVHHPIAYAVQNEAARLGLVPRTLESRSLTEEGVDFECEGTRWYLGRAEADEAANLALWDRGAGRVVARFRVVDEASAEVSGLLDSLRPGYRLALLSGDRLETVREAGKRLGFEDSQGGLSPLEKAERIERLKRDHGAVLYCGDGYNDIQALASSEVAVCMPHAPAAVRLASDVQLLRCDAATFSLLFRLGRMVDRRYRQNIVFAICYNAVVIPSAVAGVFAPWVAAAAMGSATLAILFNSMR